MKVLYVYDLLKPGTFRKDDLLVTCVIERENIEGDNKIQIVAGNEDEKNVNITE